MPEEEAIDAMLRRSRIPILIALRDIGKMDNHQSNLDFSAVEDIAIARLRRNGGIASLLPQFDLKDLGPMVALCLLTRRSSDWAAVAERASSSPAIRLYSELHEAGTPVRRAYDPSWDPPLTEFSWIPLPELLTHPHWRMFINRFERAATNAGFGDQYAPALAGAFGEMVDNVLEHSTKAFTGIAGYMWHRGRLQYVVVDAGIGILASLRQCPAYSAITNAGAAIDLAMQPGVSRFGPGAKRGMGFSELVRSMTRLHGVIRVHSDTYCAVLDGRARSINQRQIRQTFLHQGVMITVDVRPAE